MRGVCVVLGLLLLALVSGRAIPPDQIVVLIGLDGFRWDYLDKYHPPVLTKLAAEGVRAERMRPSFPSLTFPNFYTLATGLRPERHGIVHNTMFDPAWQESFTLGSVGAKDGRWWGGQPIWVTAEKQGLRADCMFWPGTEAEIQGVRPSKWREYSDDYPPKDRVKTVLEWLGQSPPDQPRLVTIYFHEVDSAGHKFGPDALETAAAVALVDQAVGELLGGIARLGLKGRTNIIAVADHGMTELSPQRVIFLSDLIDLKDVQVDSTAAVCGLRPKDEQAIAAVYATLAQKQKHFRVYRREEVPEELHYRASPRISPIVLIADEGWTIQKRPLPEGQGGGVLKAGHGFDPYLTSMGATFIAQGPAIRKGVVLPPFDNVEVYNLLCALLGIRPAPNDGDNHLVEECLVK